MNLFQKSVQNICDDQIDVQMYICICRSRPSYRYIHVCQGSIRNLWPVSKPAGQLTSHLAVFKAGYSFYTMNIRYEILCRPFVVKNLETTVYTISFVINVANCSRTIDA